METVAELEAQLLDLAQKMAVIEWRLKWARQAEETRSHMSIGIAPSPSIPELPWRPVYISDERCHLAVDPLAPRC